MVVLERVNIGEHGGIFLLKIGWIVLSQGTRIASEHAQKTPASESLDFSQNLLSTRFTSCPVKGIG